MKYPSVLANPVVREWIAAIWGWIYEFFNPELDGYTNFDFGSGGLINIRIIIFGIFGGVLLSSLYTIYVKNVVGAFVRKLLAEKCLSREQAKTLSELGFSRNPFVRAALRGSLLASTVMHVTGGTDKQAAGQGSENACDADGANGANSPASADDAALDDAVDAEASGGSKGGGSENGSSEGGEVSPEGQRADDPIALEPTSLSSDAAETRYYIKEEKKYVAEMRFDARGSGWPTFFFVLLISVICVFLIFAFLPQILRFLDNTISIFSVAGNTVK